ncbi:MAG TPA: glycine betaine ABC transporter substrate-binding protein [Clostridiales bacterium]|nr:glycine betaine ABC transporter substrate-binding protein [Clostridiales bacterium]
MLFLTVTVVFTVTACDGESTEEDTAFTATGGIHIATKNTPEQNILANLAKLLISEKMGVDAEIVYYDDSTSATLLQKLDHQEIQLFFDYSGSLAVNALAIDTDKVNTATLLMDVQNTVKKQYEISVSEKIGYNSTTSLYMMSDRNEELESPSNISAIADRSDQLTIGMEEDFYSRIDCYEALCTAYGLNFSKATVYQEEDGFMALANHDIDIFIADSVSPYYSLFDMVQIKDDQYFFLPQDTCYLVSDQTLKNYPALGSTLSLMEGLISTSRMSLMIRRIDWEGNDIADYLYTYLRANNII